MLTCQQHNMPSSSGRDVEGCLLCLLHLPAVPMTSWPCWLQRARECGCE